jgi:hypothetical protein
LEKTFYPGALDLQAIAMNVAYKSRFIQTVRMEKVVLGETIAYVHKGKTKGEKPSYVMTYELFSAKGNSYLFSVTMIGMKDYLFTDAEADYIISHIRIKNNYH